MSSTAPTDALDMRADLSRWLDREVTGLERIGGGRNSQVYKLSTGPEHFALKVYFRHANDKRDRLATEFGSFSWLWQNGIREIPKPLKSNPERGWAIYQFIESEKFVPGGATEADVRVAAEFLGRLRELSRLEESRKLGTASEAFFAVNLIVENVRQRLSRLDAAREDTAPHEAMRTFLAEEFKPLLERAAPWSEARLKADGASLSQELAWEQRTLSPSDFGFHNALRQSDGRIIFLDFEYFGWDDPAKMISDFLLHPAMELAPESKKAFASVLFRRFSDWAGLRRRVESVYPLFALKWCMILLNEFLPDQMSRREFAAVAATNRAPLQMQQLEKAQRMIRRIRGEYEHFPYHD